MQSRRRADSKTGGASARSTSPPAFTLPRGERLKTMFAAGLAIARVQDEARTIPVHENSERV
jgi:hypothetical protein